MQSCIPAMMWWWCVGSANLHPDEVAQHLRPDSMVWPYHMYCIWPCQARQKYSCTVQSIGGLQHNPMTLLNSTNGYMLLKLSLVGDPDIYLGAKLKSTRLDNGIWAWGLHPSKNVAQAVKNCTKHLADKLDYHLCLPQWADNPFCYDCCPELDLSNPLDPECSSFYQQLIGMMRWMVELGRIDIATEVSLLISHLAYPCKGHFETAPYMMSYLSHKHNTRLIFDPTYSKSTWGNIHNLIGPHSTEMLKWPSLWTCPSL